MSFEGVGMCAVFVTNHVTKTAHMPSPIKSPVPRRSADAGADLGGLIRSQQHDSEGVVECAEYQHL